MIKCVLFDIDNTLLIKKPTITEQVFELAIQANPSVQWEAVEKAYAASELWQGAQIQKENETGIRMSDEEYLRNVAGIYQSGLGLDRKTCEKLTSLFGRNYGKEYQVLPGVIEALPKLKKRGFCLGIVSNNHSEVRKVLSDFGLVEFFDSIVISEEVDLYKPNPEILEHACRQMGVACENSIYVGDHPFDILCAHSAGMPVVWLPANRFMEIPAYISAPEHTASSFHEAANILMNL